MNLKIVKSKIGNAKITQIVECDINEAMPIILPDATPEEMKKNRMVRQTVQDR
ncbi:hypothetical protein [Formosa sp. A9]|uniref:hypothetical protein n=1 Tax=Formosa sp. A9 TaxID=3442641 RepID=UPI003EBBD773